MKLKTKFQDEDFDLGEVVEANIYYGGWGKFKVIAEPTKGGMIAFYFKTLKELNEKFEDYEEPEEYWYVSCDGRALKATTDEDDYNEKHNSGHKSIGNYFETKEEAEKAVEKLKAWTRLENKGFIMSGYFETDEPEPGDVLVMTNGCIPYLDDKILEDLEIVFGGEE